jgi:hypothetical protein
MAEVFDGEFADNPFLVGVDKSGLTIKGPALRPERIVTHDRHVKVDALATRAEAPWLSYSHWGCKAVPGGGWEIRGDRGQLAPEPNTFETAYPAALARADQLNAEEREAVRRRLTSTVKET